MIKGIIIFILALVLTSVYDKWQNPKDDTDPDIGGFVYLILLIIITIYSVKG